MHEGSLYIAGRSKEIIFVNGQNYYPYDLENIAQRAPGLDLNKLVAAGVAKPGSQGEELVMFVLHRGSMAEFLPTAAAVSPPHQRAHGSRGRASHSDQAHSENHQRQGAAAFVGSGLYRRRIRRGIGRTEDAAGGARAARRRRPARSLETRLQSICEAALPGKRIDVNDNLFEIGASSLKLIEIHENVDRDFPGLIDLTELFDHPTIAELAKHLEGKLKAAPAG